MQTRAAMYAEISCQGEEVSAAMRSKSASAFPELSGVEFGGGDLIFAIGGEQSLGRGNGSGDDRSGGTIFEYGVLPAQPFGELRAGGAPGGDALLQRIGGVYERGGRQLG
jgi:hypothetical protein